MVKLGQRILNEMILVEKLKRFGENVLVVAKEKCEFFLCALLCFEESARHHPADLPYYPWIIEYQLV